MGQRNRGDEPGSWHHITNRAMARRTFFETHADIEVFTTGLLEAIDKQWIFVHAFTFLLTHFHLLVESPKGALSRAMRHVQLSYVRYFNRSRKRDGPLLRGRFLSKRVDSLAYRTTLVSYIDANATTARIVETADRYPYCSAHHYARDTAGPPWLRRTWVEEVVCAACGLTQYRPERYPEVFWHGFTNEHHEVMRRRLLSTRPLDEPLDDLITGTDSNVRRWMMRKAKLADGTSPGVPVIGPADLEHALAAFGEVPRSVITAGRRPQPVNWARAFLLRRLGGLRIEEIASQLGTSPSTARDVLRRAARAVETDAAFADAVGSIARDAIRRSHPMILRRQTRRD